MLVVCLLLCDDERPITTSRKNDNKNPTDGLDILDVLLCNRGGGGLRYYIRRDMRSDGDILE